jgi:hypothetical protein
MSSFACSKNNKHPATKYNNFYVATHAQEWDYYSEVEQHTKPE